MQKHHHKFFSLIIIILIIILIATQLDISLHPQEIKEDINSFGMYTHIAFIALYVLATITFLPASPFAMASGIIFNPWLGIFYTVLGASIGATISFYLARWLGSDFIEHLAHHKFKALSICNKHFHKHGLLTTILLRLIPLFPKNWMNIFLGLTRVKYRSYIIGTIIGILPGSITYVFIGHSAANQNYMLLVIFSIILSILIVLTIIYKERIEKDVFK